jgi:hypothetical protein
LSSQTTGQDGGKADMENGNLPTSLSVIIGAIIVGAIVFAGLLITAFIIGSFIPKG